MDFYILFITCDYSRYSIDNKLYLEKKQLYDDYILLKFLQGALASPRRYCKYYILEKLYAFILFCPFFLFVLILPDSFSLYLFLKYLKDVGELNAFRQ